MDWDRIAPFYDFQLRLERAAISAALDLAAPQADERLLDLGTGTGAVLRALAAIDPRPRECVGIDSSPGMLERVPPLPAGWSVRIGDATSLPLPAASFDLVIASFIIHLLAPSERLRALGEVGRVLRPGGRLVTVTPASPRSFLGRPYELTVAGLAHLTGSSWGLQPVDPTEELVGRGFAPIRSRFVPGPYSSLCVLAAATPPP